jgi:PAS domain S-box-containing protein
MSHDNSLEKEALLSAMKLELSSSRQILKAIFDSLNSSILFIAQDFSILFFNKHAYEGSKLLYGRELFIGDSILNYRREGDDDIFISFKENFERALNSKCTVTSEREMHYPAMSFWVRSEYTPIYEGCQPVGVLLHAIDITEKKRIENENNEKTNLLNRIAWSQSHETRQPLATLLGLVNILDKDNLSPENKEIIKLLVHTAQKLEHVIQQNVLRANRDLLS